MTVEKIEKKPGTTATKEPKVEVADDRGWVTAVLPADRFAQLKAQADAEGVSPRVLARRAVLAFLSGEKAPVKAAVVDGLLTKIEERVADLDRKIDSIAINAVRAADRVSAIIASKA